MNEDQEVDSSQQQSTTTNNSSPSTGAGPTSQTKSASPTPHQLPQPTIFTSVGTPSDVQQIWTAYGAQALWKFKLTDLKNELRSKGLVVTGNKPHIISRLHEQYMADLAQNHQPSSLAGAFSSINSGSSGTGPDAAATTTIGNEQQESSSNEEKSLSGNGEASLKEPSDEANMLNSSFYQQQAGFRPGSLTPSANGSRLPPYVAMQQLMNSGFYPTSSGTTTTSSTVSTPPATKTKPTKTPSPPQSSSSASPSSSTNPNTGIVSPSSSTSLKTPVSSKMQGSPNSQSSSTTTTPVKPSPSAAVLSSESPPSPVVPRTGIESIRSSFRPTITIPRALTPACDPSVYSTFSPASAQYMPHAFSGGNQSGTKKVVKKKVVKKVVKSAQSTIPATSNTIPSPPQSQNAKLNPTLAKPPRQLKASSKLKVKKKDSLGVPIPTSTTPAINNPVATSTAPPVVLNANGTVPKRRGRPPKNKNAMSAITVPPPPTVLTSSGKIVKKVRKIRKDARKVDPVAIASGDLRKLGKEVDSESRSSQQIEDSLNSDATSESDVETSCNFDNYFNMEDDGMSLNSSASMTTDLAESFLTATDLNLVGEIDRPSSSMASRKRALLEDEFYGLTYSSDGSPHKRPRHGDIDDDSFFICSTVQEVPESILESALMEETFGACQSEYCFEVNLVKHNSKPSVSSAMGDGIFTMMDEEFETRKLSVGGSVSLHDLTKSVIELFTYDTYGGAGADLGVDSDSLYVLMLPCGRELVNPESAPKPKKSSDSLQVASAKLSDQEVLSITFPTKDDPTKTQCVFNLRVERISITSAADDGDLLLTNDEEDAEMMMDFMVDSYLTNCDADVEDEAGSSEDDGNSSSDDGGSNDEDGPAVDDLLDIDVIIDGQFLIEGM